MADKEKEVQYKFKNQVKKIKCYHHKNSIQETGIIDATRRYSFLPLAYLIKF